MTIIDKNRLKKPTNKFLTEKHETETFSCNREVDADILFYSKFFTT